MAEYIDKQTALEIIASFRTPYRKEVRVEDVYDAVSKVKSVEIIQCKDCKRFISNVWLYAGGLADVEGHCGWTGVRVMPHNCCSYAIRREDETN